MQFSTTKKTLLRAVAMTHAVAERKSPMPMLASILVSVNAEGKLRLQATDMYLGASATADVKVMQPGSVAVPAKTLHAIVKSLPEGDLRWSVSGSCAVEIACGRTRFKISGLHADDFPALPQIVDEAYASLHAATLASMISKVSHSMSGDDTRPQLASILFESDGKIMRMVSTDGHRMSMVDHGIDIAVPDHLSVHSTHELIPAHGVLEIKRLLDEVKDDANARVGVAFKDGHLFVRRPDAEISVRLAGGEFPPYRQVIPKSIEKRVICSRSMLIDALRRVSLVSSEGVNLSLSSGALCIAAENASIGEGQEDLEVDYDGKVFEIRLRPKYLIESIVALSCGEVALDMSDEMSPVVVKPIEGGPDGDFIGVIMPMRT